MRKKYINHSKIAYQHVLKILKESLITVKLYLESGQQNEYEIKDWIVSGKNDNIIKGVHKFGQPIKIVIRPTHGGKIIFNDIKETKSLLNPRNELWGSDGNRA